MAKSKKIVIGNWKMKLGIAASLQLAGQVSRIRKPGAEVVVCPSFTSLQPVGKALAGSAIQLGAQDVFWEEQGAYTGEVAAAELIELGCRYVIIGHSERRQYLNEADEMVHKKTKAALAAGLTPVVCVGETYAQRQEGGQDYVVIQQINAAISGIQLLASQELIVAYEPVWVIGSGQAIDPAEAEHTHQVIRYALRDALPPAVVANQIRIVYGGSVDSRNISRFSELEDTAGVLVGGASLNADEFGKIISALS